MHFMHRIYHPTSLLCLCFNTNELWHKYTRKYWFLSCFCICTLISYITFISVWIDAQVQIVCKRVIFTVYELFAPNTRSGEKQANKRNAENNHCVWLLLLHLLSNELSGKRKRNTFIVKIASEHIAKAHPHKHKSQFNRRTDNCIKVNEMRRTHYNSTVCMCEWEAQENSAEKTSTPNTNCWKKLKIYDFSNRKLIFIT